MRKFTSSPTHTSTYIILIMKFTVNKVSFPSTSRALTITFLRSSLFPEHPRLKPWGKDKICALLISGCPRMWAAVPQSTGGTKGRTASVWGLSGHPSWPALQLSPHTHGHTLRGKQPSPVSPHFTRTKCEGRDRLIAHLRTGTYQRAVDPRSHHQLQRGPGMMPL